MFFRSRHYHENRTPFYRGEKNERLGQYVCRRGRQKAGTAGLTPHPMVNAARFIVDEIAGIQSPVVNLQYPVEKVQLLDARMRMSGVIRPRIQPNQHAHAVIVGVPREDLDVDTRRRLFPRRCCWRLKWTHEWLLTSLAGDSPSDSVPKRLGRTQYVRRPSHEGVHDGA